MTRNPIRRPARLPSLVCSVVKGFLQSVRLLKAVNFTHVCLIPKAPNPTQVSDLHPIALCNVLYKVIANRLKRHLSDIVSPCQSALIPASGQRVNFDKSSIVFSKGVELDVWISLASILGVNIVEKHEKYLGLPTVVGRNKTATLDYIKEQLSQKLKGWQEEEDDQKKVEEEEKKIDASTRICKHQFFNGRQGPYNRPEPCGNFVPRGRGYGGRGRGHGGLANVWQRVQGAGPSGYCNRGQNALRNPPKAHDTNHVKRTAIGNEPCNRCGFIDHWSNNCRASSKLAADYKKYRESRDQEAYNTEEEGDGVDVNLTIADFQVAKDQAQSMEVPDFD
ncbi:hypothetical protein ACLB2K_016955 [Fragaria x ananassa]